jgi:hypothetical protein
MYGLSTALKLNEGEDWIRRCSRLDSSGGCYSVENFDFDYFDFRWMKTNRVDEKEE